MILKKLELQNFRNYKEAEIDFSKGVNILYGDNAQGKTNILEAVYVGATSKSHRGGKEKEMIRFGEEESHIKYYVERKNITDRVDIHLKKGKTKGIAVNGVPLRKASDLFGFANVVCFSPEDLTIIKDGPAQRRKFLDMELCQLDKVYLNNITNYNKVLLQRNKLLKELDFHRDYWDTLQIWDMQLLHYGQEVIKRREAFLEELNPIVREIHRGITGGREEISLVYEANVKAEEMERELEKSKEREYKARVSLVGPHRDDLGFFLGDMDIRTFGSQGQQRTAALSLKLSEIEIVKKRMGEYPILLLDDVLSELDAGRQEKLLDYMKEVQTIITCTGVDEFVKNRFPVNKIFRVEDGRIVGEN